jgi:hypothetical protein
MRQSTDLQRNTTSSSKALDSVLTTAEEASYPVGTGVVSQKM